MTTVGRTKVRQIRSRDLHWVLWIHSNSQDCDVLKQAISEAVKSSRSPDPTSFEIAHSSFACMINKNTKGVHGHQW